MHLLVNLADNYSLGFQIGSLDGLKGIRFQAMGKKLILFSKPGFSAMNDVLEHISNCIS